jgi:DNA-binding protein Fis
MSKEFRVDATLKQLTIRALTETKGNRVHAAKLMGISLRTVRNWIHKYGLGHKFPRSPGRQK